jgi:ubiquitin-conjugating enzyme E2 O
MTSTEKIYVRAFEERMDLLRVAIVGAPGTPYHDGLFFFDIYLPPEYPHEPPVSCYI